MPTVDVLASAKCHRSFRAEQVCGMYDLVNQPTLEKRWRVAMPIEEREWAVGLIVGPSGSGKTQIARAVFGKESVVERYEWSAENCLLDDFPGSLSGKDVTRALTSVGFSSPPQWLKSYHHLSNGQKMRCDLARSLTESRPITCFDEFTSVVDRTVAKVCSAAVAKSVRRTGKKFVAISCHYDVAEWLEPDWIYDVEGGTFQWCCLRRPKIEIKLFAGGRELWPMFAEHHYLSHLLPSAARCFVATWDDRVVAFASYLHFPHAKSKNIKKGCRMVVLPDFQGVGIGNRVTEMVGDVVRGEGNRLLMTSSNPAMIYYWAKSPKWKKISGLGRVAPQSKHSSVTGRLSLSANRLTATFEYIAT